MQAEKQAALSQEETAKLLDKAKKAAAEIVATARDEASSLAELAQKKAEAKSEALLVSARDEISKEIENAKRDLKADTLQLVALATEKVIHEKVDFKKDSGLIEKALKEAK